MCDKPTPLRKRKLCFQRSRTRAENEDLTLPPPEDVKYELHQRLGEGGFGNVYKATVTKPDGRKVERAAKVQDVVESKQHPRILRGHGSPSSVITTFFSAGFPQEVLREMTALRMLKACPYVVDVHEVVMSTDTSPPSVGMHTQLKVSCHSLVQRCCFSFSCFCQ